MRSHRFVFLICALFIVFVLLSTALILSHPELPLLPNKIYFYSNQKRDDLGLLLQEAFKSAKKSISISIFNFSDHQLLKSLKKAESRGVTVGIFADKSTFFQLEKIFPQVRKDYKLQGLMHRKIVIIDDQLVFIGSANFTKESLQVHENILLAVKSPFLAEALLQEKGGGKSYFFLDQTLKLWLLPEDKEAEKALIQCITSAQKSVKVAMFTWTSTLFVKAVIAAHKRGLQVEVALDRQSCNGTSRKIAQLLHQEGISIFQNQGPGLLHHKFALIDDKTLITGSANWTVNAFKRNAEIVLILNPLTAEQLYFFKDLWRILTLSSKRLDKLAYAA